VGQAPGQGEGDKRRGRGKKSGATGVAPRKEVVQELGGQYRVEEVASVGLGRSRLFAREERGEEEAGPITKQWIRIVRKGTGWCGGVGYPRVYNARSPLRPEREFTGDRLALRRGGGDPTMRSSKAIFRVGGVVSSLIPWDGGAKISLFRVGRWHHRRKTIENPGINRRNRKQRRREEADVDEEM